MGAFDFDHEMQRDVEKKISHTQEAFVYYFFLERKRRRERILEEVEFEERIERLGGKMAKVVTYLLRSRRRNTIVTKHFAVNVFYFCI